MDESVFTAIKYAAEVLPQKPRLASWITQIDLGDDRLQLRAAEFAFTLSHPLFISTLRAIEPLLDGLHPVDEIARAGGAGVLPTTVLFLLKMLHAHGLLQEGAIPEPLTAEDCVRWEQQLRFFSHFGPDPLTVQAGLARARVGILEANALSAGVRSALASLGVGQVVDLPVPPAPDEQRASSGGASTALVGLDLLVACQESPGFAVFDRVNAACLAAGTRWLRVAIEGTTAYLGPTIIPHQTACYTCYSRRIHSNVPDPIGYAAYHEQIEALDAPPSEGAIAPLWSVIAGQVALEVARLLTVFAPPTTIGRFHELSAVTPLVAGHDVLRVPRCPSCGPGALARQAWDQLEILRSFQR